MFLKFAASPITLFGKGCRAELPALLKRENKKHALVVTDMGLEKLGIRKQVTDLLENEGIKCEVYNKVCPNPTMDNVLEGKEAVSYTHRLWLWYTYRRKCMPKNRGCQSI